MLVKSTIHALDIILLKGGITLNTETMTTIESGYAVGIGGGCAVYKPVYQSKTIKAYQHLNKQLERYDLVGAWVYKDSIIIEPCKVFDNRIDALEYAFYNKQIAIYDLENNHSIFL